MNWIGTVAYLIGMILTSLNIYPLNLFFGALGGLFWAVVGWRQRDNALLLVEVAAAAIYAAGILKWLL